MNKQVQSEPLSIHRLQKWCELIENPHDRETLRYAARLSEEFGEIIRSLLVLDGKATHRREDPFPEEAFDFIYNVCLLASLHNIDLEDEFQKRMKVYEGRYGLRQQASRTSTESATDNEDK